MNKFLSLFILVGLSYGGYAQHIFPKKLNGCYTSSNFCLDCGDIKVEADSIKFSDLLKNVGSHNNINNLKGKILFQVLVDSVGKGCVLSHTDVTGRMLTEKIVMALNDFTGWTPARKGVKIEPLVSINVVIAIANGKISGGIQRVTERFADALFNRPIDPEISNTTYTYANNHLSDYKMSVWNSSNSIMKHNLSDFLMVDKTDMVFYETIVDLVRFNGTIFNTVNRPILSFEKEGHVGAMAADNNNVKWFSTESGVYSYDDKDWILNDSSKIGARKVHEIINNEISGEVFFTSDRGLIINKNGNWSIINKAKIKELPSDRIYFAKKDKRGRTWIGTFSGSIMIEVNGKVTNFNEGNTLLKEKCITAMEEDNEGNIYFGLYDVKPKEDRTKASQDEGLALLNIAGSWKQFTTLNSGMPSNQTTGLLYDAGENILWITTEQAGLVRYDLKGGWENYHSKNSAIPTSFITGIVKDSKRNIYLSTRYGMVKIEKK